MSNTITTVNPYTEKNIKTFTLLTQEQAKNQVDSAHKAFLKWKLTSLDERCSLANKLADTIEKNEDALITLMVDEMGKVKAQAKQEIALCAKICRYIASEAAKELQPQDRDYEQGYAKVVFEPLGVILGIQPWNFPLYQVIRYSITNVVAGNTTVMKHASNVFGMATKIQEMYEEAGFDPFIYQSLLIDGETASELIVHPSIQGISFTGSDGIGKKVAEKAAALSKKTVLELGSNDAFIVLDDADIEKAIEACVKGRVINNGETCVSAKRFIVTEKNYNTFKEGFKQAMSKLHVGDPNNDKTDLGPMAREDLLKTLHEQVEESVEKGAKVVCGGKPEQRQGFFYPPSILENISPGMPAYDDELFGPVASLIKAKDNDDALRIANDSRYGLGGGIFSKDVDAALNIATKHFDTGMVNINGYGLAQPNLPFGGVKQSGYGREHGGFGITEFINVKTIMIAV